MTNQNIEYLLKQSIHPNTLKLDENLTIPRSYATYQISNYGNSKRFRYGNHPIRQQELIKEFGSCTVEAIFLDRQYAKELADLFNA